MKIQTIMLNENVRPLFNKTFINCLNPGDSEFSLRLNKNQGVVEVVHPAKGIVLLPLASVSWMVPDPEAVQKAPQRRKVRPPKED